MKKIKLFIVTYNNNKILQDYVIDSLNNSNFSKELVEIFVIDNYGDAEFNTKHQITVLKNSLRSSRSTGHLSRNWNQSIILGFEDLNNPQCDAVIAIQNDTKLVQNWYENVCILLEKYNYITLGGGDQLQVFTPMSVKNIGLFDERFCSIAYQEADYLLRAKLYYGDNVSINDFIHGRTHNTIESKYSLIEKTPSGVCRGDTHHISSQKFHHIARKLFKQKWGIADGGWDVDVCKNLKVLIPNFIIYPFFEKNINKKSLEVQNYNL